MKASEWMRETGEAEGDGEADEAGKSVTPQTHFLRDFLPEGHDCAHKVL